MLKKYKKTLILTSFLTLLPILVGLLLWNQFPEKMITHWGITGEADGWSSVPFAVFVPPLLMLAVQWLCIWFTGKDPGNQNRNQKLFTIVLWIIPVTSNFTSCMMYALALGMEFNITSLTLALMGVLFAVIGNYMPKTRMNATMGIKVPWVYTSDENWRSTHRFSGKLWVIGGIAMLFGGFLPETLAITVMLLSILILTVIPVLYSYLYYKKQKANGDALTPFPKAETAITKGALIVLAIVVALVLSVLFTGQIDYQFREDYLFIDTNMYTDYTVHYGDIQNVEYREGNVSGSRVGGYGSFRLLMGYFRNDEFGTYIRYTYTNPETCVILTGKDKTIVLSGETAEKTQAIYQELLVRTGK